jgi:signal transduction histidine kinase
MARQQDKTALRHAQAANELREQFIAILGHDLRNPLQAVYSAGVLLEKRLTDPALQGVAGRIRINVKRMTSLINDILDFARARLGEGMGVKIKDVDAHGGTLSVSSNEQSGTHFTARLPLDSNHPDHNTRNGRTQ